MAPNGRDAYFWRHDRGRRVAVRQLRHSSPFAVRPAGLAAWRRKYPQAPAQRDRAPAGRDRPALFVCVLRREEPAPDHKGVIAAARQRGRKCAGKCAKVKKRPIMSKTNERNKNYKLRRFFYLTHREYKTKRKIYQYPFVFPIVCAVTSSTTAGNKLASYLLHTGYRTLTDLPIHDL